MTERRLLPVINPSTTRHGSRSFMTCKFRCNNACDHPVPNVSDNTHISAVLAKAVSRRSMLKGGAAGAATLVVTGAGGSLAAAPAGMSAAPSSPRSGRPPRAIEFDPVPPNKRDAVTVARGYTHDVVVRWGDPVVEGAPEFDVNNQTPEAQAMQFGYNCDYVGVVSLHDRGHGSWDRRGWDAHGRDRRAVMSVNNEYTDEFLMFPEGRYDDATIKRIAMAAHGISVVEIQRGRRRGSWRRTPPERSRYNRRITANTPMKLTGPAAGDDRLKTTADCSGRHVLGTVGDCAGGVTPWGTTLHGEENFNGYFDASGRLAPRYAESYDRYGITGDGRGWSEIDPRFDLTAEPNEPFRFGYIVEVDVLDPDSTPRKLTMLGRFKHEGANCTISPDGRAVVYMGDDEIGDYIYKFVSRDKVKRSRGQRARRHNLRLLDAGTLYVARFEGDGTEDGEFDGRGFWIPLATEQESFVEGFSVADVLLDTRLAADKVGPTKMDRPEDIEPNPVSGKIYCALTNNDERGTTFPVDEANPLASSMVREDLGEPLVSESGNRNGYVLELTETRDDPEAGSFGWNLFLVCGDPNAPESYFGGFPKDHVSPISCPDNVAFDADGNLWIATDGSELGGHDGLFQVPVEGPDRGQVLQFQTVPVGAECAGPLILPDNLSIFTAIQHPGEVDGASFEDPASTWPHTDAFPRPSVVCAYRC